MKMQKTCCYIKMTQRVSCTPLYGGIDNTPDYVAQELFQIRHYKLDHFVRYLLFTKQHSLFSIYLPTVCPNFITSNWINTIQYARLERLSSDKHSYLFGQFVSYDQNLVL